MVMNLQVQKCNAYIEMDVSSTDKSILSKLRAYSSKKQIVQSIELPLKHSANVDGELEPAGDDFDLHASCNDDPAKGKMTLVEKARKAAVAVSGGALIAVGIPLIPLPGMFMCVGMCNEDHQNPRQCVILADSFNWLH